MLFRAFPLQPRLPAEDLPGPFPPGPMFSSHIWARHLRLYAKRSRCRSESVSRQRA